MPASNSTVMVIDDDPDLRGSVGRLLRSLGIEVQLFESISDFLASDPPDGPAASCSMLDCQGKAVSIYSASSPRRTEKSRSFS